MPNNTNKVLLTWVARNNDPYERNRDGTYRMDSNGEKIWGPTLTLLFDSSSPYRNQIKDIVIFYRIPPDRNNDDPETESRIVKETIEEIQKIAGTHSKLKSHLIQWNGSDPTDHLSIFQFLSSNIPRIRSEFEGRELIIHISPGTPSMHTIWVLMAETGFIAPPFVVVKSYRLSERENRGTVVPVQIGIESFYKVYRKSRTGTCTPEQELFWDPALFRSHRLKKLYTEARRFARIKIPVLLLGERGTGKTMLASWIRSHSPWRKKELDDHWPCVICGQYTPEMMRTELFGYKKGSFTGATHDCDGLIKIADGDTLFLDEIGDISKDLQRLLIRALEEKTFLPLGATITEKSDFRLLTATNRTWENLQDLLDADFLDRIGILHLRLPALREIRDDIPWLWEKVWQQAKKRSGLKISPTLSDSIDHSRIIKILQDHPLPGNLRNLFQVAYRLVAIISDEDVPSSSEERIQYALEGIEFSSQKKEISTILQNVASSIARHQSIDHIISSGTRFPTKALEGEFRNYLATEIRRIAKMREISVGDICDVTERTILNWSK